jgi:hypothetical protein
LLLQLSGQALETSAHDRPDREHVRDRPASNDPIKGLPLEQDRPHHDLQARKKVGIVGNATPPTDPAGTATNSPVTQWPAIRMWNGNSGGFLINRDLPGHPANDYSPASLDRAA